VSLKGRRAAVIGTGSTREQLIPEQANNVSELTVYQRTPIWVLPKLDFGFSPSVQRLFATVPLAQRILRWFTDTSRDLMMVRPGRSESGKARLIAAWGRAPVVRSRPRQTPFQ
jgi:cation diffusion facilitator CzcD-associated flavoprotein CzcO